MYRHLLLHYTQSQWRIQLNNYHAFKVYAWFQASWRSEIHISFFHHVYFGSLASQVRTPWYCYLWSYIAPHQGGQGAKGVVFQYTFSRATPLRHEFHRKWAVEVQSSKIGDCYNIQTTMYLICLHTPSQFTHTGIYIIDFDHWWITAVSLQMARWPTLDLNTRWPMIPMGLAWILIKNLFLSVWWGMIQGHELRYLKWPNINRESKHKRRNKHNSQLC